MQVKFARTLAAGVAFVAAMAVLTPNTASAQTGFVIQANYGDDVDLGVGAGIDFGLGSLTAKQGIRAEATFDYYFPGDGGVVDMKYWEINGNLLMDIKSVAGLYVGAGVNYANTSWDFDDACGPFCEAYSDSNSDVGLNILGGYSFGGQKSPFVQAKFELGGAEQLIISGGIRF